SAQPVKIGEGVDGYVGWKGDVDYYQFNVYQKGTVVFELAGVLNIQFVAVLFDQDVKQIGAWSADKAGESLTLDKELDAGTYYLRLAAKDPGQSNVRDKYSLRLKVR